MSFFKQMSIVLSILLGIILFSVMVLNFKTATEFIQNQLYTDAKNTAHSLGLSLSKVSDAHDLATMGTMIDAIYDSGYYEKISLRNIEDRQLYIRETKVYIEDVPEWFVDTIPLHSVAASSKIMIGWSQLGSLEVKAHIGHAYRQLYATFKHLIETFFVISLFAFGMLYILLSISLRSLEQTREQAKGIIENKFIFQTKIPFTTEFRAVTIAMNAMVEKVKDIFERENETLKRYHELLYRDTETGLHNRRYILATLPDTLIMTSGIYVMMSMHESDRLKRESGYENYHNVLMLLSNYLNKTFDKYQSALVSRLNENDFFVVIPNVEIVDVEREIKGIISEVKQYLETIHSEVFAYFNIGSAVGEYIEQDSIKSLLSRADHVVTNAKIKGSFQVERCMQCSTGQLILGRDEWREELMKSMEESRILIATQRVAVFTADKTATLHEEVYLRLQDKFGRIHSAGYFIPVASSLGIVDLLDRYMIQKVLAMIGEGKLVESIALNLSGEFIKKYDNIDWLKIQLSEFSQSKKTTTLWFEVSNSIALQEVEAVSTLCALIKSLDYKFGIDHFVMPSTGAGYLQKISPVYLKCNRVYLEDVLGDIEKGESREGFLNIVTSLGIAVIVNAIEHVEHVHRFRKHGLKGFQGSYIAPVNVIY